MSDSVFRRGICAWRGSLVLAVAGLVAVAGCRARGPATGPESAAELFRHRFSEVVPGVWVAARPEPLRSIVEGNATVLVNDRDVVVVDASASPAAARDVIAHIRRVTRLPVRYVVLTHIHRDHRFGLQEYLAAFPNVEVIAHPAIQEVIATRGEGFVATTIRRVEGSRATLSAEIARLERRRAPGDERVIAHLRRYRDDDIPPMLREYQGVTNLGPTATVADQLTLHRGARRIEVRFLGRGDTDADLVVYLPHERLVVAGDMVVHPFPYGFSDQPGEWLATLRKLEALDFAHLVPGHGEVQHGKAYLRRVIALLEAVQGGARQAAASGGDAIAARQAAGLDGFLREMAGDDPVARYYFEEYFAKPALDKALRAARDGETFRRGGGI